jgi:5-methylthioadenosine/S-adenosylhomocysteine deaminase
MMDRPTLIADAFVIACDPEEYGGRLSILLRGGRIADLSLESQVLRDLHPEAEVIDASQMLVIPGFVNAHYHPESLLFRDLTAQVPFALCREDPRFQERTSRVAAPDFHDGLLAVHALAAVRHLRSGVTTVSQTVPPVEAHRLAGLQEVDRAGGVRTMTVLGTWEQIAGAPRMPRGLPRGSVSLGDAEDFTVYSLDSLPQAARELGIPLFAHVGERREEVEVVRHNFKKGMVALLRDYKILDPSLQLVHLNHGGPEDASLAAEAGVTITLCPRSAARKRSGYPLLRHLGGQRLCLGTDWGDTDMMREMTFMVDLPLLIAGMPAFTPLELLRMATINGAVALGLGAETGSIERGKKADLVAFGLKPSDLQHLGDVPAAHELASVLLSNLTRSDIAFVIAHGNTVYRSGSCTLLDEAAVVARFRRVYSSISGILVGPPAEGHARILPFVSAPSPFPAPAEGFEEGFAASGDHLPSAAVEQATPPAQEQPVRREPQTRREVRRPELSKNVRRVFGEDDDPAPEHK